MSQKKVSLDYPYEASNFKRSGLADWLELYLHDHGFLRLAFQNLYQIDNYMWRSNQPSPKQIEHAHNKFGIKTILNLRGPRVSGGWQLEAEVCDKLNINLINFNETKITFSVSCSKGTYIRVLGKEIAEKLGTVGYLDSLIRTRVGEYFIDDSVSLDQFKLSWKSYAH